jgi:mannose-6-phosphate isomerase-like protein (cupin superfamily)
MTSAALLAYALKQCFPEAVTMQLFGLATNLPLGAALLLSAAMLAPAPLKQATTPSDNPTIQTQPEVMNLDALADQGIALLEQAREGSGSAGITLAHYKDHYTMLTARTKSGGGELHGHYADFLFVIAGEGTEMTGGAMLNPKELPDGEVRGTSLEGATPHILHRGDVIHIPAGTPHQAIEAPGQSITIFVIKVHEESAQ